MEELHEVSVVGLVLDPVSKSPVMILRSLADRKIIPIWIGMFEANSIALELEHVESPRPMTHDLLKNIMSNYAVQVNKVIITDIVENTYYAELYVEKEGQISIIDCRPSDAVAIALKHRARIFVTAHVLESSLMSDVFSNFLGNEEKINDWFNSLAPEDFGSVEH